MSESCGWTQVVETYLIKGQQVGAELEIVVNVKRTTSLESRTECSQVGVFCDYDLFLRLLLTVVSIMGGRQARGSARAAVVIMRLRVVMHVLSVVVLLVTGVEESRHDE